MSNSEYYLVNHIRNIKSLAFYHLKSAQDLMSKLEAFADRLSGFSSFIILEAMEDSHFYYGIKHIKYSDVNCLTIINRHSEMMSNLYNNKAVNTVIPNNDTYFVLISGKQSKVRYLTCYDVFNACNRTLDAYKLVKSVVNRINNLNS